MDRKLLKQNARLSFKKKYGESIVIALIMGLFTGGSYSTFSSTFSSSDNTGSEQVTAESFSDIFSGIPEELIYVFFTIVAAVLCFFTLTKIFLKPIFTVGGNRYFLKLRKDVNTGVGEVAGNFKDGNYWNIVKISLIKNIKIALWSMLFIIPGIVKAYEYFLIDYILAVRPDIDSKSAFRMSKALMKGYKSEALVLELSFIGWNILDTFTCGILGIFHVNPYKFATFNEFYSFIRIDGLNKGLVTPMELPDYELVTSN